MEQYGRRLCFRIDSVPKQDNEKAEDVFVFGKGLIEEVPDLEIPEVVKDRAHRIGPDLNITTTTTKQTKKCRKCVSLLLSTLRCSVILLHFTELEGLPETEHRLE